MVARNREGHAARDEIRIMSDNNRNSIDNHGDSLAIRATLMRAAPARARSPSAPSSDNAAASDTSIVR